MVRKGDDDFLLLVCSDARRSSLFAGPKIHQEHSSGADTVNFVFFDSRESLDRSAMPCGSFVIYYLKLYSLCDCTFYYTRFPATAFVHKTYTCDWFSYGCSVLNLTYVFRQHNSLFANVAKHCVGLCSPVNIGKITHI